MAITTLEKRLETVENELFQIKQQLAARQLETLAPNWEKIFGTFADSEGFEEAMRLGREYRDAQNENDDELITQ